MRCLRLVSLLLALATSAWAQIGTPGVRIGGGGSGGATTLDGLSDVTITSAATGQVLVYSGTAWANTSSVLVDTTNKRIGINTTPTVSLDIALEGVNTITDLTTYFDNAAGTTIRGQKYRGTVAAPRRVQSGDVLFSFNLRGGYAVDDATAAVIGSTVAQLRGAAAEAFTSTGQGTIWELRTTPIGSTTAATRMTITDVGNIKIAGTATRATTEGTNHLDIFDGTAPVGTLANGISLYSTSGELRAMDAAGNATLLSPHNFSLVGGPSEPMAWAFYSERGGVTINVDMLRVIRIVERLSGEQLVVIR